ncbi:MAG TPA: sigma-70 family RNA polymerase sigma factor [Phycisphaerae bacterium]|nr:RNA polymerase subunit sigma-70 [Phycisphaerales bacterium]HRX83908.1 sigma-70 family RNA polymerase sigma factor [Phycisphaerae bacterium]
MTSPPQHDATRILADLSAGDASAGERLLPVVYAELRAIAARCMRNQPADHTWQPTALVHEAYLRLIGKDDPAWSGRGHFLAVAAKAMRHLLVDHARRRLADKRGGDRQRVTLCDNLAQDDAAPIDALALDDALRRLATLHPRQAQIIELRFFGGLTIAETARALDLGTTTVEDDFVMARAWLARELADA